MARIIIGSYMFRYPMGGMLSYSLQYILGLKDLGHDVYVLEKSTYSNSCFDPSRGVMSDDCSYGIKAVSNLLTQFGMGKKWCYVNYDGHYLGLSKKKVNELFKTTDLFIDHGTHGSWTEESLQSAYRVLIEGEPGYKQMKWANDFNNNIGIGV